MKVFFIFVALVTCYCSYGKDRFLETLALAKLTPREKKALLMPVLTAKIKRLKKQKLYAIADDLEKVEILVSQFLDDEITIIRAMNEYDK